MRTQTKPTATSEATTTATAATSNKRKHISTSSTAAAEVLMNAFTVNCLMNAQYHASREAFLDGVHRWFMFGVIIASAGSIAATAKTFFSVNWIELVLAALAATIGTLDLVFDLSNRARTHALMKRRYFELLADVEDDRRELNEAKACLHRYSADEEPAYYALLMSCWNSAQESVHGEGAEKLEIPRCDMFWKHFLRRQGKAYKTAEKAKG